MMDLDNDEYFSKTPVMMNFWQRRNREENERLEKIKLRIDHLELKIEQLINLLVKLIKDK